jgi:hypothetical protein
MSHKTKKHKAKFYSDVYGYPPISVPRLAVRGPAPDFDAIQRQAERRAARNEELRYRIAPDCKVHIQFNGIATQEAIRKLIHYLEIGIGDFPLTADDPTTQN